MVSDDPRPLRVEIVGDTAAPSPRRLWRDVALVVLSVVFSGAVALGVARYTVEHDDRTQDALAEQQRLADIYRPLASALAEVMSCIPTEACADSQLLRAGRAANAQVVTAHAVASGKVDTLATALHRTLGTIVKQRLDGNRRPSTPLARRAAQTFVALQAQISKELER